MPWMLLTPREVEEVGRGRCSRDSFNAGVLERVRGKLTTLTGDLDLTDEELEEVYQASRRWQDGGEVAFKAILSAADRHTNDRR